MFATQVENFALTKGELTRANVEPFRIELSDFASVFERPMRYNKTLTNCINEEVESLRAKGLIYPANSSYAAKVIMAPKGDGWRMCLNYVGVNAKTKPDRFPLSNIEDIYTWMTGAKVFSKIDLLSGYWQVPVELASQQYTGFITQ